MYFYVTYNEPPNGLYASQVIDVVNFLRSEFTLDLRLFAFVPLRDFRQHRRVIKKVTTNAIVVPAIPGWRWFRLNQVTIALISVFMRPKGMITRNGFANYLARQLQKRGLTGKVVYDARGLMKMAALEYNVYPEGFEKVVEEVEHEGLDGADLVMSITQGMIDFWKEDYGLKLRETPVIIPCTVSSEFEEVPAESQGTALDPSRVWLAYVGSVAGWQSFGLLKTYLEAALESQADLNCLFISAPNELTQFLEHRFPGRVLRQHLSHHQVPAMLRQCDYGLLIREASVLNSISSPTKLGEYLCCGLPVVFNDTMAFTKLLLDLNLGILVSDQIPLLLKTNAQRKSEVRMNGLRLFSKRSDQNKAQYARIVSVLKGELP